MGCYKITKSRYKKQIQKNIAQKLNEIDSSSDMELEWDNLKTSINYVAYDDVGTRINTKSIGWFDVECGKAIKTMNEARKKCVIRDTRANKEEYMKRRKEKL